MEDIKNIIRIHKVFISKKPINNNKTIKKKKKNKKSLPKDSIILENSTDLSSNNILSLEEKNDTILKEVPNLDDIVIPSFLNDIPKSKEIENYYKYQKLFDSPEIAKIYLVDIKRLYEQKKQYYDKF